MLKMHRMTPVPQNAGVKKQKHYKSTAYFG
jgi:hypothetical protein